MPRMSRSPMPSVKTLVTGMAALVLGDLHDLAGIDDRALAGAGKAGDAAVDDIVEHDDAAGIADASRVVGTRHPVGSARLASARDLRVLGNRPSARRRLGLRHRCDGVRAGSHGVEHLVDLWR